MRNELRILILFIVGLYQGNAVSARSTVKEYYQETMSYIPELTDTFIVVSIDSVGNGKDKIKRGDYAIYVKNMNGALFKVCTHLDSTKKHGVEMIHVGDTCVLTITSFFRSRLHGIFAGGTMITGTKFYNSDVTISIKDNIWDIYETEDINGLYLVR